MGKRRRSRAESHSLARWSEDPRFVVRRKRQRRQFKKIVRAILAMLFATFVLVPGMIAGGFLFGPRGIEGLILAPVVLFTSWALILAYTFRRRATPRTIIKSTIAALPAQTETWLEEERSRLPWSSHEKIDSLALRLEALTPQVEALDPESPSAAELRRLLAEELPELVRTYRKVPRALAQQPLYGGTSPERQLLDGLETIDKQVGRVHERLATSDLHALATHQRYLELKYERDDEDEPKKP